jgi:hypothetical protein
MECSSSMNCVNIHNENFDLFYHLIVAQISLLSGCALCAIPGMTKAAQPICAVRTSLILFMSMTRINCRSTNLVQFEMCFRLITADPPYRLHDTTCRQAVGQEWIREGGKF